MKSILEKALVHLLNEESEKAQELMHQFVVERARSIHETLRESDEADLDATDAALEEEFFTESDLDDAEAADQLEDDLDGGDAAPAGDFGGDVEGEADAGADMGADMDGEVAADDTGLDGDAAEGDLGAKIDNIESEIASLQAEFDKIMAEFDGGSSDDETMGDDVAVADETTVADDAGMTGDEGDEFDDITESMVDDLKKISVPNEDGKGANGEKLGRPDVDSPIAKDAKNRVLASKNTVGHTGWEPSKKDGPDRGRKYDNNRVKATAGNAAVPATGPKGAELNKPVQSANLKSVIPGGKVTKK
jgi:hypothetical protein